MSATPGFFQGGGREIAAVASGDGGPEVETVFVVDAVEAGHVDVLFLFPVTVDVFGDEAEGFAAFVASSMVVVVVVVAGDGFGQYWFVVVALGGF